jgi:hypothetical protein
MKKLQVDPKGMEVVKKTITATVPAKTKGGVPLETGARLKFYESEIKRHNELLKKYPEIYDEKGKLTKEGLANSKKGDQIISQRNFLEDQLSSFKAELDTKKEKARMLKLNEEIEAKRAARPFSEKFKEFIRNTGSPNNPVF